MNCLESRNESSWFQINIKSCPVTRFTDRQIHFSHFFFRSFILIFCLIVFIFCVWGSCPISLLSLGVLLCPLPHASRLSVLLCSMLGNFKQTKNRTVISKSVGVSVTFLSLCFFLPRVSFPDGPLLTKGTAPEGKISKEDTALQLQSGSAVAATAAASSFFFFSSSSNFQPCFHL